MLCTADSHAHAFLPQSCRVVPASEPDDDTAMNLSRTAMLTGCTIIAALCALTLSSFAAETAFGTAPKLDCGSPSDIHDGWVIGSSEQQGLDPALLCAMGKGVADGKLPNVDSIVVVRHGVLVYERYFAYPHQPVFDANHQARWQFNDQKRRIAFGRNCDRSRLDQGSGRADFSIFSRECRS